MTLSKLIDYRNQYPQLWLPRTREEFIIRETQTYESLVNSGFIDQLKNKSDTSVILRTGGTSSLAYKILPSSPHRFKYNDHAVSRKLLLDVLSQLGPAFLAQLLRDKMVFLPGNMFEDGELPIRYVSNALVSEKGWMGEWVCPVPQEIFDGDNLPDVISKLRAIALCYEGRSPAVVSGVPWVVLQFAQVREEIYGQLLHPQVIIVWGCAVTPYVTQLHKKLWADSIIIPFYNATEGTFAYQPKELRSSDDYDTLKFKGDCGVWYEFMDHTWQIIQRDDIVWDTDYVLLISTYDGLCRYEIGDVIQFVDVDKHRFHIKGRTSEYIDIANEHTQIQHIQQTMSQLEDNHDIWPYCVFPSQDWGVWYYVIVLEAENWRLKTKNAIFAQQFDQILQTQNCNYAGKRDWNLLWAAQVIVVDQWWFEDLIAELNHERLSTQSKLLTLYPREDNPVSIKLKN